VTVVDWVVVAAYLTGMVVLAARLGVGQRSRTDYYLGSREGAGRLTPLSLASSTIATQCSTNSLLGAPAFVGFAAGGGLLWLQYELAVPLAMLAVMFLLVPMRRSGVISVYEFLEQRLGLGARLVASLSFQLFRGVATGVTVYGVALVITLLMDVSFLQAVLLLMVVTVLYDVLGGMRAVVISDVAQLLLLSAAVVVSLVMLSADVGGFSQFFTSRTEALNNHWGFDGAGDYGFWPMLIGGLFLYTAYYGCDQSQAQRVLSAGSERETQRVLLYNGLLRFPLVLAYCILGLGLAAYAAGDAGYVAALPERADGTPNYNVAFPYYVLERFSPGLVGLVMVGIFAAAMSSIDSSINALSAATVEDCVARFVDLPERKLFAVSKILTLFWGLFAVVFSFQVERIAPTVLEAINKIGSMINGPLLALFVVALLLPGAGQGRAIAGFAAGVVVNTGLWLALPQVSWLWWNVAGCVAALAVTGALSRGRLLGTGAAAALAGARPGRATVWLLLGAALLIFAVCAGFDSL
jgi:SSS family transporter